MWPLPCRLAASYTGVFVAVCELQRDLLRDVVVPHLASRDAAAKFADIPPPVINGAKECVAVRGPNVWMADERHRPSSVANHFGGARADVTLVPGSCVEVLPCLRSLEQQSCLTRLALRSADGRGRCGGRGAARGGHANDQQAPMGPMG